MYQSIGKIGKPSGLFQLERMCSCQTGASDVVTAAVGGNFVILCWSLLSEAWVS